MSEEYAIHIAQIVEVPQKGIQNTKTIIQNGSYLTTIYIDRNWDQNENWHNNRMWDTKKTPQ